MFSFKDTVFLLLSLPTKRNLVKTKHIPFVYVLAADFSRFQNHLESLLKHELLARSSEFLIP